MNGVTVLSDGKKPATKEQIMECEENIDEYDRKENTACLVIVNLSWHEGQKPKNCKGDVGRGKKGCYY